MHFTFPPVSASSNNATQNGRPEVARAVVRSLILSFVGWRFAGFRFSEAVTCSIAKSLRCPSLWTTAIQRRECTTARVRSVHLPDCSSWTPQSSSRNLFVLIYRNNDEGGAKGVSRRYSHGGCHSRWFSRNTKAKFHYSLPKKKQLTSPKIIWRAWPSTFGTFNSLMRENDSSQTDDMMVATGSCCFRGCLSKDQRS